jgi:predicted HD superfamily hydrolase involved in NAD metabolism
VIERAEAEALLEARLSRKRLAHTHRVAAAALELARRFGVDEHDAELAGLLHDYCRELDADQILAAAARHGIAVGPVEARRPVGLLHGAVAAAELAGQISAPVAQAIARHTVGCAGMSDLDKVLYLADFCEPGRDFPGVDDVRALARESLDAAISAAVRLSLLDLIGLGRGVVPAALALYNDSHARD